MDGWNRVLHRGFLAVVLFAGCQQERPKIAIEESPFEVVDGTILKVRPDLMANIRLSAVEETDLAAEVTGLGRVAFAPGASYALRVPFDGFVETVLVGAGEIVEENQVLATIRSSELAKTRADFQRLSAEVASQTDALKRAKELLPTGAGSERNVVALTSTLRSLEAQRDGIRHALTAARTTEVGADLFELRAPRAGHVITRKLDPGELAEDPDNVPAFVIADPKRLVVKAYLPERDAPLLDVGFPCRVTVSSLGQTPQPGHVTAVVQAIDPESRTVEVVCTFDSLDSRLRAEMLARVTVSVKGPPRVVVPRSAVLLRRDSRIVLVRRGDCELERREVVVGAYLGSNLEILSGVHVGDEIVVEGAVLLDGELDRLL